MTRASAERRKSSEPPFPIDLVEFGRLMPEISIRQVRTAQPRGAGGCAWTRPGPGPVTKVRRIRHGSLRQNRPARGALCERVVEGDQAMTLPSRCLARDVPG